MFFFMTTPTSEIYTLSLHDALPIFQPDRRREGCAGRQRRRLGHGGLDGARVRDVEGAFRRDADRKSTRLNSSHEWISYAVFCLKKKKIRPRARHQYRQRAQLKHTYS